MLAGKYSKECNLLGTLGELGIAFTGLDVAQDLRDLSHDVLYWETNWEHVGETVLDGVALLPVVGVLAKSDELLLLCKRGDNLLEIRRAKSLPQLLEGLDGTKYLRNIQELPNTAASMMKEMSAELYYRILNCCEGVPAYRLAYAGAGGYSNPMILVFSDYADDLSYISRVSPETANDVITEVAQASGKSSDEVREIAEEAIEEGRKKADEIAETGKEKLKEIVNKIPEQYKQNFKCSEFANEMEKLMLENGIKGYKLDITSKTGKIWSIKYGLISENGKHYAIKIDNIIYDNLNPNGINYDEWVDDLGIIEQASMFEIADPKPIN